MRYLSMLFCSLLLLATVPTFTGCAFFKDEVAPVAEGQDAIVVNAERAQRSTLDIFELVTTWEFQNRASLPAEVSRAVDAFRKEFPPAWRQSRQALKDYKAKKGPNASDVDRITAALLVTQENLLRLRNSGDPNQALQAMNALSSLVNSIRSIMGSKTSNTNTNR